MKRKLKNWYEYWANCWSAFHKVKVQESENWVQYYSVFKNKNWTEPKIKL